MNAVALSVFASVLLTAACAGTPADQRRARAPATVSSTHVMHRFLCDGGETIIATYPSADSVTVRYGGDDHRMRIAVSGSGTRYVGDGLEWWTSGSGTGFEGVLVRHLPDETSGDIVETCTESDDVLRHPTDEALPAG